MSGENFWRCLIAVAAELEGGREESEEILNLLENGLRKQPRYERDQMRRRITLIVAQLARLEMRLLDAEGPLPATYPTRAAP